MPTVEHSLSREGGTRDRPQLGDGPSRAGDRDLLATRGTIDDVATLVAQFPDADLSHDPQCITRDTRARREQPEQDPARRPPRECILTARAGQRLIKPRHGLARKPASLAIGFVERLERAHWRDGQL